MTSAMAPTPQPHVLSAWITAFTGFDEAHGFAVNLFAVAALAATGAVFLTGKPRLIRPVLIAFTVLCLADWVLIEDFGFFGGLGTDPNSMIPMALLAIAGYLALTPAPVTAAEPATTAAPDASWRDRARLALDRVRPAAIRQSAAAASIQSVAAVGAIGLIVLGAAPMAAAQANPVADTILAQAIDGSSAPLNFRAPAFSLTDQHGRLVTLASLRGKVILLTFLDDTCSVDCPLIAQEFRQAGQLLSADSSHVELVAINYNPINVQVGYLQAFDRQEGLDGVPNWLYLTGTSAQLQHVWARYGAAPAEILPAGSMVGHGDYAFVLDQAGHIRQELGFDTGPGTQATKSSFAAELTDAARQLLGHS
jgi:cytochrome oxidase Cu insertion factor (SCO1/SenC/PrrC family)